MNTRDDKDNAQTPENIEEPWDEFESVRKGIVRGTVSRPCRVDKTHGDYRGATCPRC